MEHYGGAAISLIEGDITQQHVDVIVNSTTRSLNHSYGPLAEAISRGAGEELVKECKEKYPKGISRGDVAVTSACQLPCQHIYHVALAKWSPDSGLDQSLRHLLEKVFKMADDAGYKSISIPAIGAGKHRYPQDVVAQCMFETAIGFTPNSICEIVFVVKVESRQTVEAYERERDKHPQLRHDSVPTSLLNVRIVKGDISKEDVDVIVNSTTTSLDFSGPIARAILKEAGDSLHDECKTKYPDGIEDGEIAETSGGNLKCQAVYHIALPRSWSEQTCRVLIMKCLETASDAGMQSIAFPALGTGALRYPRDAVAKCFYDCFDCFGEDNPDSSLTEARIVVYHIDKETIKIFEEVGDGATLQQASGEAYDSSGAMQVPGTWRPMSARADPKEVTLHPTDHEYMNVIRRFHASSGYKYSVVEIQRIQNRKLFLQYELLRDDVSRKNPGMTVHRRLWHGTHHDAVAGINRNGFSRSYCSITAYGQGTYFAVRSQKSVGYTNTNSDGHRHIYEAEVVVGHYTKGDGNMRAPPSRDADNPEVLYDTVVDNVKTPSMFVVFNDVQAYPKYLITFHGN